MLIKKNVELINDRISISAKISGRKAEEIMIVAATKTVDISKIIEAISFGLNIFGENYIQEAEKKIPAIKNNISWHFIGHLQKNKAKAAVTLFDIIETVDSFELAEKINSASKSSNKIQKILIQVNPELEVSKHGINPENTFDLLDKIQHFENIDIRGLMMIPPFYKNPEENRKNFSLLRSLKEKIDKTGFKNWKGDFLSMGMSEDFEIAIEEGSNLIRLGRAIFGERLKK